MKPYKPALLALLAFVSGCSSQQTPPAAPQTPATQPTTQTLVQQLEQPQPHNDTTNNILSIETDHTNSQSVAEAFGCGWWAQPIRDETLQERTNRLKNLTSTEIGAAMNELRHHTTKTIIKAYPGETTKTGTTNNVETFTIQCTTTTTIADNIVDTPTARTATIETTLTNNKWEITKAQLAGLTLP